MTRDELHGSQEGPGADPRVCFAPGWVITGRWMSTWNKYDDLGNALFGIAGCVHRYTLSITLSASGHNSTPCVQVCLCCTFIQVKSANLGHWLPVCSVLTSDPLTSTLASSSTQLQLIGWFSLVTPDTVVPVGKPSAEQLLNGQICPAGHQSLLDPLIPQSDARFEHQQVVFSTNQMHGVAAMYVIGWSAISVDKQLNILRYKVAHNSSGRLFAYFPL